MSEVSRAARRQAKLEVSKGLERYRDEKEMEEFERGYFDARFNEELETFIAERDRMTMRARPARVSS